MAMSCTTPIAGNFTCSLVKPDSRKHSVAWTANGDAITGGDSAAFKGWAGFGWVPVKATVKYTGGPTLIATGGANA
jgi:hypothetical protein